MSLDPDTTSGSARPRRGAVTVVLAVLGVLVLAPTVWVGSAAIAMRTAIDELERRANVVRGSDKAPLGEELAAIDAMYDELENVLYDPRLARMPGAAAAIRSRVDDAYAEVLRRDFAAPAQRRLEKELRGGGSYLEQRERLALYLVLRSPERADEWASQRLASRWSSALDERAGGYAPALAERLGSYVRLLKRKSALPPDVDEALVAEVRGALERIPGLDRLEASVIHAVRDARCDPSRPLEESNLDFRPFSVEIARVSGRPLPFRRSRRAARGEPAAVVDGLYTGAGHSGVLHRMKAVPAEIERFAWVVAPRPEERADAIEASLRKVYDAYAERGIAQWTALLDDVSVTPPKTEEEARELVDYASEPDYFDALAALSGAATWPSHETDVGACGPVRCYGPTGDDFFRRREEAWQQWRRMTGREHPPLHDLSERSRVAWARRPHKALGPWHDEIAGLRAAFGGRADAPARLDRRRFVEHRERARAAAERLIAPLDEPAKRWWGTLLLDPLRFDPGR